MSSLEPFLPIKGQYFSMNYSFDCITLTEHYLDTGFAKLVFIFVHKCYKKKILVSFSPNGMGLVCDLSILQSLVIHYSVLRFKDIWK